ncbi:hypothetical protein M407DRAFT_246850 [Tulasnella calospora MUT 4182]|uniref:Translocon-associated protein subunit alpha n=1 Tax=Tulasnella calospora MUT 4182 TaxID=1051891 RepID=A0A0C3Q3D4_9AGAM|nr:hypothetical protein M407DRAFT_246850 [Tulasnella calospora MUT 4182]
MRFGTVFSLVASFAAFVVASPLATELDITATAAFPSTNPFAHVVNGERNSMSLEIENKSALNVTLKSAAGSIHDPESGKLLKNTTALTYGVTLVSGAKTVLPYNFYSEHKPKEVNLKIWVDYDSGTPSGLHRVMAYDSVVSIVEPPASFFDLPLLFTYLMLAGIVGGAGYLVWENYAPKSLKKKARKHVKKDEISAPVASTTATTSAKADDQWLPPSMRKKAKKVEGVASSGDESAASGTEKRRARKAAAAASAAK